MTESFTDAQSNIRFISAYLEGDTYARAQRMIITLMREAIGYLPAYQRWALAAEIRDSVNVSELSSAQGGQLDVLTTPTKITHDNQP